MGHLAPVEEGLDDSLLVVQLAQPTRHHRPPQPLRADGAVPPPGHEGHVLASLGGGGGGTYSMGGERHCVAAVVLVQVDSPTFNVTRAPLWTCTELMALLTTFVWLT